MDRRSFLLSSALSTLHLRVSSGLKRALQNNAANLEDELKIRLSHDSLRPQYHLLPPAGSFGDPCAPRFFRDQYHAFFHGNFGGRGWHHAISPDLVHWRHMPIALSPTENSYDSYGTFTGSVLPSEDGASIIYTGVTKVSREQETIRNEGLKEVQCVAVSSDTDLRTWHKLDEPVIESPPAGKKITGFRDPFSWMEGEIWYAGVGSGFEQEGGAVLLYRSKDARHWEYQHPLAQGTWNGQSFSNPVPSGEMWECPDFFALGEKHVLIYSTENKTFWEVGTFDRRELRFHSERKGLLDHGKYYAPKSMMDRSGTRFLWGWVQEARSSDEIKHAGWAGAMSLPRLLTLNSENELLMNVAPELDKLRRNTVIIRRKSKEQDLSRALSKALIEKRSGKVVCTFKAGQQACGLELRMGASSEETTLLTTSYVYSGGPSSSMMVDAHVLPLHPNEKGLSTIEIWIDGSIIEIFLDSREVFTTRCYSLSHTSDIRPMWNGPPDTLESLTLSTLAPISDDRLTT